MGKLKENATELAILFLRIFIGGVMLLHMVGKLQDYDNVVLDFYSLLSMSQATSFALTIIFEGLFAVMIIMGVGTRLAALMMCVVSAIALGEALVVSELSDASSKLQFIYFGIYLTLLISGGGKYALSEIILPDKNVLNR
ncbi:MAG: DoxX family protein [Alistipes sp.]|nr:DoxX family protein [Alistipes sp.]